MHIPDGFLSLPVSAGTIALSSSYGVYCHKKIKENIKKQDIPLIACITAFIFAAQMLNFPVLAGTSGHFMGSTLAVFLFGPYISFFIMTIVLVMQALLFGDGGLLAIGANVLNMAVVGPLVAYFVIKYGKKVLRKESLAIFMASLLSIVTASIFCSIQVSASGIISFNKILIAMVGVHTLIGIGEGLITIATVSFLVKTNIVKELKNVEA
ncbi:MAG TPA: energy-coupling factor ABC transporter permease [bacterium]|nr:energy-coupling factor ABC transporter permease [bacterium]